MKRVRGIVFGVVVVAVVLAVGGLVARRLLEEQQETVRSKGPIAVPVEVAEVMIGPIVNRRVFSGSLEPTARVQVAPKVSGRIVSLSVDLSDDVVRGDVIARLDDDEARQFVMQSEAELAVAEANLGEARNALGVAERELERTSTLYERGIASESQHDTVRAEHGSKVAAVKVAEASVTRARASLESARIRLGYATVAANWEGGDERRVVSERLVEEGDTVSANEPLVSIIELDPIEAVIYATERDYAELAPGQPVSLTTDAHPGRVWSGEVSRVSPVFREGSRQARVEIRIANPDRALKPGMFVRVESVLGRVEDATIVPVEALSERDGERVVFLVNEREMTTRMVAVETGITEDGRVQVFGDVSGRVVTLGQQLLTDGASITIPGSGTGETEKDAGG